MSDDEDNGLFNIQVSDDDDDATTADHDKVKKRSDRTGQSEADFQAVKRDYRAKVENGEIYKTVSLPLGRGANKQHVQQLLHAVEELYFFRRYQDAVDFVGEIFEAEGSDGALDEETRQLLSMYESRCKQKIGNEPCP